MAEEDLNVKKDRPPVRAARVPVGAVRRTLFATSEFMRGFSLAAADGWRAFSNAVDPEVTHDDDFVRDTTDAMFDANKRFVEDIGTTSRQFFDRVMDEGSRMSGGASSDIDYERLARMVADELDKRSKDGVSADADKADSGASGS
jgi:hypothetical protein